MTTDLAALREQRETIALQAEIAEAKRYLQAVRSPLMESDFGDWVNPREYLYDTPDFNWRQIAGGGRGDSIDDRLGGKDYPVFETEQDLADIRGQARVMATRYPSAINILEALTNYTVGTGLEYEVQPTEGQAPPQGLVEAVKRCVDAFLDDNDWIGDFEREIHERTRTDGEAFIHLRPAGWRVKARVIEPAQVVEPQDPHELEAWQGCAEEFCSCWKFGVHTRHDDPTAPIGYHVVYDGTGAEWDYIPAARMEHLKRNTARNVKRGVSDFYPAVGFLRRAEKLLVNTNEGAAVQAAIAFIRKHAATTTASQAQSMRTGLAYDTWQQPLPSGGTRTKYVQKFEPGTIIDTGQQDYQDGPGARNAPNFIAVLQASLRYVGIRWCMPEYMMSGDASNANYASTLVAESPFVKAREADQAWYISRFGRIVWKALKIAFEGGYFSPFGLSWPELESLIDVKLTAPEVASRNQEAETVRNQTLHDKGILSKRTWAGKAGLDYDEEVEKGAKEAAPAAPFGGMGGGEPAVPAMESIAAIADALKPAPPPTPNVIMPPPQDHTARDNALLAIGEHLLDVSGAVSAVMEHAETQAAALQESQQQRQPVRKIVKRDERGKIIEITEQ